MRLRANLIVLLALLVGTTFADPNIGVLDAAQFFRVYVNPPVSSYNIGTTFNLTVEINEVSELFAWQFTISWDFNVLDWGGIFMKGNFLSTAGNTFFAPDLSRVSEGIVIGVETLMGTVEASGSGTLVVLGLTVIAEGETTIHLSEETFTYLGPPPIYDLLVYSPEEYELEDGYFSKYLYDIAITDTTPSKTVVGQEYSLSINVTVENQGDYTENFNATVYADTTIIDTFTDITLTSGNSATNTFTWNTTGFAKGNYTISAYATPVPGEIDIIDNNFTDGWVIVAIVGDVNADGIVNIIDLAKIGVAWGTTLGDYLYNPNADINDDGIIDIADLATCAYNYLKTDP